MKTRMIIMLAVVGVIVGGLFGFQVFKGMMIKQYMASLGGQPQTVSAVVATIQEWNTNLDAVGTLRAVKGVDLSAETAGTVDEIHFDSGDEAKAGTLLVTLRADNEISKLKSLEATAKLAETTYQRDVQQLKAQAVSQATVDIAAANFASAKAQVAEQKALVDKKTIHAPFAGRLGIRKVDIGQYLNPGTVIVTLQSLDPIYLDFYLPQQSLAKISVGQNATVRTNTYPDKQFTGRISAINAKVDVATRNVEVRVELDNPEPKLLPGMYATVSIEVGGPQRYLTLPQTAITYNPYGETVFLVEEKGENDKGEKQLVVQRKFVVVGPTRGDQVAILKGIGEGDTVVTSGQIKLQNGAAVTVNNAVVPSSDADPKPSEE